MRIAQLAPLWETVPPKAYGGTELIVYILCEEFIKRGHDVTLFSVEGSKTPARLKKIVEGPMRELNVKSPISYELKAISELLDCWKNFDIIHNHMGYQFLPFVELVDIPVITTLHGALIMDEEREVHKNYKDLNFVSISNSQRKGSPDLNYVATVYNGIQVERFKFEEEPIKDKPYLAFLGRMSEEKGPHLAIKLAKKTGWKLIMAGKVDKTDTEHFEEYVKPFIDNEQIIFVGELGHKDKVELLKGAHALIHAVTWPEPFGLTMIESMACGTPVLAINKGSIPEVVKDGITGFVEDDIDSLIKRVRDIPKISRLTCRKYVEKNFSDQRMAESYLSVYKKLVKYSSLRTEIGLELSLIKNLRE